MTSVGTVSFEIKKILKKYLDLSGDPSSIYFKLHDFGLRGVSSRESGMLGGMSHLVNFKGSDNAISAYAAKELYDADLNNVAFSIPAAEHSSITSWGKGNEVLAYKNMVTQFSKPGSIYAVVSDSYDIFNAVENIWGKQLASYVKEKEGTLVIRPDSGDPVVVIPKLLTSLYKHFGGRKNEKGYVVLNNVRLIWGDGIEKIAIQSILSVIVDMMGFSVDNIAFGMGGGLLQHVNRDTQKFAMKCSAAKIDGTWVDVFKDPITDKDKTSKKGLFDESSMRILYNNGKIYSESFDDICKRSETYLTT
jgi:nicotinamide phosphoribosyltransferase